ncbi:MAG: hypothetical protein R3B13_16020 [Polyangiaceae bacterium]
MSAGLGPEFLVPNSASADFEAKTGQQFDPIDAEKKDSTMLAFVLGIVVHDDDARRRRRRDHLLSGIRSAWRGAPRLVRLGRRGQARARSRTARIGDHFCEIREHVREMITVVSNSSG